MRNNDYMKVSCGDPVRRKDDPRHTCRVIKIENSNAITIKWDGWYSVEPLSDI